MRPRNLSKVYCDLEGVLKISITDSSILEAPHAHFMYLQYCMYVVTMEVELVSPDFSWSESY